MSFFSFMHHVITLSMQTRDLSDGLREMGLPLPLKGSDADAAHQLNQSEKHCRTFSTAFWCRELQPAASGEAARVLYRCTWTTTVTASTPTPHTNLTELYRQYVRLPYLRLVGLLSTDKNKMSLHSSGKLVTKSKKSCVRSIISLL